MIDIRLAVCLLTADRPLYTAKTLTSFEDKNPGLECMRLMADDGSTSDANRLVGQAHGFELASKSDTRLGQGYHLNNMWRQAFLRGATHILHLENDWEFDRSIKDALWLLANSVKPLDSVRLYGNYKERDLLTERSPVGEHIIGTKDKIIWDHYPISIQGNAWYEGEASWGGPPSISRASMLCKAAEGCQTIKAVSTKLDRIHTLKPEKNHVWHIGADQTTNFNGRENA